jgi:hypothetical protein
MQHENLKLKIDLIPKTAWYQNLRTQMRRSQWDKLRKKVYVDQGNVCRICGAGGTLSCHEVWHYDEERFVQKLLGFHALCGMCHHVTHFGLAQILASQGHLDLEAVIEHFKRINGVGREVFESHKAEAFRVWRERSRHKWQPELGEWASLVDQKGA